MKQRIVLIISVVVGFLAFFLSNKYLSDERARLYEGVEEILVLAARRALPAGTILERDDVALVEVIARGVGQQVFGPDDQQRVLGTRLRFPLERGDPITWFHVELPEGRTRGLASMVRPELRALSIPISGAASVSGLVSPNDRVDILGTFTFPSRTIEGEVESVTLTLLQDVTVLATGQRLARDDIFAGMEQRGMAYSMITFEVTPREAELLVFAQHVKGQLHLSLRNPEAVYYEPQLPSVNFDHIETKLEEYNIHRQQVIRHKQELNRSGTRL